MRCLADTCRDSFRDLEAWVGFLQHAFCVFAGMGLVWSTHVVMHNVTALALEGLVNTC